MQILIYSFYYSSNLDENFSGQGIYPNMYV